MTHTPLELAEEFPDAAERIHALKGGDTHFSRLVDDYHAANREIHRSETRVEAASDTHEGRNSAKMPSKTKSRRS